jgi:hypothetical protein
MCRPWEDVVVREAVMSGEAAGEEELFDRKMRELDNSGTVYFDDRDQARTCAENFFLGVLRAPTRVNWRSHFGVKADHHGFRKLFSTEGANGNCQTLKKAFSIFTLLVVNALQPALVGFIQSRRQFLQGLSDTLSKAITQRFQLANDPFKPRGYMRSHFVSSGEKTYMP